MLDFVEDLSTLHLVEVMGGREMALPSSSDPGGKVSLAALRRLRHRVRNVGSVGDSGMKSNGEREL